MPKTELQKRVDELIQLHGVRGAARLVGIDASYLQRLQDGKSTGSPETLKKLGLRAEVRYTAVRG